MWAAPSRSICLMREIAPMGCELKGSLRTGGNAGRQRKLWGDYPEAGDSLRFFRLRPKNFFGNFMQISCLRCKIASEIRKERDR